jgi:hypothetical protein
MGRLLAIVVMVLALPACASWPDKPRLCFASEPLVAPTNSAELKAVEFVKRRIAASCKPAGVECNVQLQGGTNGEIQVVASKAFLTGSPPTCERLEGGFETYVFSPQGKYVRVELGL